jgi:hypothetical protein
MNDKRKIEINIVEIQPYKILIQINSNVISGKCFIIKVISPRNGQIASV